MKTSEIISLVTVPFFMGAIGYVTNWTGVWMLFEPIQFKGVKVPGLRKVAELFPRKVQDVPGIMNAPSTRGARTPAARRPSMNGEMRRGRRRPRFTPSRP